MDEKFLIDTNIVIYYLNDNIPDKEIGRLENIFNLSFNISTITNIEVLGWHRITQNEKERIGKFLANARIFYVDDAIEQKSIDIKQKYNIATPDTIIGATAIIHNLTVVTRNEKDFKMIEGLKVYNPFQKIT